MPVDDLIQKLQTLRQEYGNLPCVFDSIGIGTRIQFVDYFPAEGLYITQKICLC